ncbi:hypothetical protein niasHT_009422 [Heterodera trifolii]|uniref:Uncharacterized protein n=1 Tax=Heterodera trifolii TaxID=157864 RepID=A0ABD2MF27_9BILA
MPFSSFSSSSTQQINEQSSGTVRKRQNPQHNAMVAPPRAIKSKVVVLGDMGVGKTSILLRHDGQGFTSQMSSTLGASYICSRSRANNGREFELQIWDTAGQERFRSMVPLYMRNSSAAMLVFDITNRQSFRDLASWIKEVERIDETGNVLLFIVANKCDLKEMRMVSEEEGRQFAEKQNAHYCETSALSGKGIETVMSSIAECLLQEQQRLLKESAELGHSSFDLATSSVADAVDEKGAKRRGEEKKNGSGGNASGRGCCTIL